MPLGLVFASIGRRSATLTAASFYCGPITRPAPRDISSRRSGALTTFAELAVRTRLEFMRAEIRTNWIMRGEREAGLGPLYDACYGTPTWAATIFGDIETFRLCMEPHVEEGTLTVAFSDRSLPAGEITIWVNETEVSESTDELVWLLSVLRGEPPPCRPLRIGMLRSGDLPFTQEIRYGFQRQLAAIGYELHRDNFDLFGPPSGPFAEPGFQGNLSLPWRAAVEEFVSRTGEANALVTIGSQASAALRDHLGTDYGRMKPVLFVGVSYPVESLLVDSLYSRFEPRQVAGVGYGADGLQSIAALVANWLLPERVPHYIYFDHHPQDREAASQLRRTRLFAEGRLRITATTPETFGEAIADRRAAFFSWCTFEEIFEGATVTMRRLRERLRKRVVVASTRGNCREGDAVFAAGGDDRSIGALGAEILHDHLIGRIPHLGRHSIAIPRVGYWLNTAVATRQHITFSEEVRRAALEIFDVDRT